MSAEDWIKEFYPINADEVKEADALDHSIQKWKGLLPENLAKHGLTDAPIFIDDTTCALCALYMDLDLDNECEKCPLSQARGGVSCDLEMNDEDVGPYERYLILNEVRPMLTWLLRAKELKK